MLKILHFQKRDFCFNKCGNVAILFALSLTVLTASVSFSLDLSKLYLARQKSQTVSDLAALAAVDTPSPIIGSTASATASATAIATARAVAIANGFDRNRTIVSVETSPAHPGVMALKTALGQDVALPIGLLSAGRPSTVNVASWAEPNAAGSCFRSQSGPTNIYNAAVVNAPACTVEAKTYLYSCGTSKTTMAAVSTGYAATAEKAYLCSTASITPPAAGFTYNAVVDDTMAASTPVTGMLGRLDAMAGGWAYGSVSPINASATSGSAQTYNGVTATVPANARFSSLTVTNANVTFSGSGTSDPTCASPTTVSATLTLSGTNIIHFGSGCYVFAAAVNATAGSNSQLSVIPGASVVFIFKGTLTTASGSSLSFGDGPFYFYGGSISNNGTMTLGNGPFRFQGGSMALNAGSVSSFGIGDMEFYGGTVNAGGTSVTFGAGGSAVRGSGAVLMYGGSFSLTANSLTAVGTSFGFKGGTLSLLGIGTINATAPTDPAPALGYRNLLFGVWGGAFNLYQSGGQMDTMSGMVYAPTTNASIYGSQTVTPPAGGCFGAVSGVLDIYQNARINGAPCAGLTGSAAGKGALVQ